MEKPKYIYEESEGTSKVTLIVTVDGKEIQGLKELIIICDRLATKMRDDLEELTKSL